MIVDESQKSCEDYKDYECVPFQDCYTGEILSGQSNENFIQMDDQLEITAGVNKCANILQVFPFLKTKCP